MNRFIEPEINVFVIVLDFYCVSTGDLTRGLSRVFKGQTGFEFWVLRFRFLRASFSSLGCFVFEFWVLRFRDSRASFSRFGCFVLRSSFSKVPPRLSLILGICDANTSVSTNAST